MEVNIKTTLHCEKAENNAIQRVLNVSSVKRGILDSLKKSLEKQVICKKSRTLEVDVFERPSRAGADYRAKNEKPPTDNIWCEEVE